MTTDRPIQETGQQPQPSASRDSDLIAMQLSQKRLSKVAGLLIVGTILNGDTSRTYLSAELTEEGARK